MRDVVTATAVVLRSDSLCSEIVHLLLSSEIGGLPVVDADGGLIGVETTPVDCSTKRMHGRATRPLRSTVGSAGGRRQQPRTAADLMAPNLKSATLDEPLGVIVGPLLEGGSAAYQSSVPVGLSASSCDTTYSAASLFTTTSSRQA